MTQTQELSWSSRLIRYFFHGIVFWALFIVLQLVSIFSLALLVAIGLYLGWILGVLILFFFMGGLNTLLTEVIWSVEIKSGWIYLLVHGLVLFILLFIAQIPGMIITYNIPNIGVLIAVIFVDSFTCGLIAKRVAVIWKQEQKQTSEQV